MAARQIIVPGAMPSRDPNGRSLPAKLRFYQPGTLVPATVYADEALTTAHPFPLLSDAAGRWPQVWAEAAESFSVGWSDQVHDATIATFEGVRPVDDGVLASVALAAAAAEAAEAAADRAQALLAEATGEPFTATSGSSLTVGLGARALALDQAGKLYSVGQTVVLARTAQPETQMTGVVTAHDPLTGAMSVQVAAAAGSGTHAGWTVALSSSGGVLSIAGETGVVTAPAARAALDVMSASEARAFAIASAVSL